MRIDRKALVTRHNPHLEAISTASPLSVGNGDFAFTADITGLQSLYSYYKKAGMPLCTQSQWGWHSIPFDGETVDGYPAVTETGYPFAGRTVYYPTERVAGEEKAYNWLRENPHRLNLARVGLALDGEEPDVSLIGEISQTLNLYTGILESSFTLDGEPVRVRTACNPDSDCLAVEISSFLLKSGRLEVLLDFPYGYPWISASDFENRQAHTTEVTQGEEGWVFDRRLDDDSYRVILRGKDKADLRADATPHRFFLKTEEDKLSFTLAFRESSEPGDAGESGLSEAEKTAQEIFRASESGWKDFWEKTGAVDFSGSSDCRAEELERRIILSQYLLAIQCCGKLPPQETGLTCNSWCGKFHLEMTPWHMAWLPLWGRSDLLMRVMPWYKKHLPEAIENAKKNGYKGARWPKQIGPNFRESPSTISPLIIWQQPHVISMLELIYRDKRKKGEPTKDFLREYYPLVKESADFLADYAVKSESGEYEILPPLVPVQECWPSRETKNPAFEVEYWRFGLGVAGEWTSRLGLPEESKWTEVKDHMVRCESDSEGLLRACSGTEETYGKYAVDHPSFLMAYGLLKGDRLEPEMVRKSLVRATQVYDEDSLWGWDFAVMAMTAVRLGDPELAVSLLLRDSAKNSYEKNGHNRQADRDDLPLYLPGNGSLLLAVAMMCAGYEGCDKTLPGFPAESWTVRYEGIEGLPE